MVVNSIIERLCEEAGSPEAFAPLLKEFERGAYKVTPISSKGVAYFYERRGVIEPHFAVLRRYWGEALEDARQALEEIRKYASGKPVKSFIQKDNKLAQAFVRKLGFRITQTIWVPGFGECLVCEE